MAAELAEISALWRFSVEAADVARATVSRPAVNSLVTAVKSNQIIIIIIIHILFITDTTIKNTVKINKNTGHLTLNGARAAASISAHKPSPEPHGIVMETLSRKFPNLRSGPTIS